MNPYNIRGPQPLDLAAIAEYTRAVEQSHAEYEAIPNAACYAHDCDELARTNDVVCGHHRRERNMAALRMRVARHQAQRRYRDRKADQ